MQTLFEQLEGRSVFSSTPIEFEAASDAMLTNAPTMPFRNEAIGTRKKPASSPWVDAIDPDFFVKPPLARAG